MRSLRTLLLFLAVVLSQTVSARAFTREVYVWQRQFSPAVFQALREVRDVTDGSAVLALEVSWSKGRPEVFRSSVDFAALAAAGRPVGLVLRVGPYPGITTEGEGPARFLVDLVMELLASARRQGLEPAELQVDFDCASAKLGGYRVWLEALRQAAAPVKLTFTALPDWLGRDDFSALARAADGFVLQVHSLEKPTGPDEIFELCDPVRAWAWIQLAGAIGVPFRVALPTYGYRLAFDATGRFEALSAEGPAVARPAGTRWRTVRTDVSAVSGLARRLASAPPAGCTGVIWFRLPAEGDQLNWNLVTLKTALRDKPPVSRLEVEVVWVESGLAEVSLVNRGEQDEKFPTGIQARWAGDETCRGADGLGGYQVDAALLRPQVVALTATSGVADRRIAPERRCKIGWMRFSHEIALTTQLFVSP